jgi:hypothetical protein
LRRRAERADKPQNERCWFAHLAKG